MRFNISPSFRNIAKTGLKRLNSIVQRIHSAPSPDLSGRSGSIKESQVLLLGSFSAILYIFSAYLIRYYQGNNLYFQLIYLSSVTIFPAMLFFLYKKCFVKTSGQLNAVGELALLIHTIVISIIVVVIFIHFSMNNILSALILYSFLLFFGYLFKIYDAACFNSMYWVIRLNNYLYALLLLFVTAAFSNAFFKIFSDEIIGFLYDLVSIKAYNYLFTYILTIGVGAAFLGWVFFSRKANRFTESKCLSIAACCAPILLFDVMNNFDIEHYNAYLAPAIAVLNGKIPLVDVFCHYGLCYLVFTLGFLIFPHNYAIASLIVSILNIGCWVVLLLMMRTTIKNPLYFFVISITSLFGINYLFAHTINLFPSALFARYLPTVLLSHFLLLRMDMAAYKTNEDNIFRLPYFNVLLFLNVFWSFETLISLWIIYGAYLWISMCPWRVLFKNLSYLLGWTAGAYLFLAVVYGVLFGQLPNYWIYLEYIYSYMNPHSKIGDRFLLPESALYRDSFIWVFLAVLHLLGFFYLIKDRWYRVDESIENKKLLFLNVISIVFMAYFVLQTSLISMMASGYPSFILLFSILVMERNETHYWALKWCSAFVLFFMTLIFFSSVIKSLNIEYNNFYRNGDILYAAFNKRGFSLNNFFYNLTNFCSNKPNSPGAGKIMPIEENSCKRNSYHKELSEIIKKWYANEKEVLLFHRDMVETLLENNKVHKILVSPENDSLLESLQTKILRSIIKKVHEGDIVVIDKDLNLFPIEIKILKKMSTLFKFILLEETPHLRIFKLKKMEKSNVSDMLFPLSYNKIKASINYQAAFEGKEPKVGIRALVDKDKETAWFVKADALIVQDVFWIWVDLGELFFINDIKIWRKIDFRKPEYAGSENFRFISNFNIELSEDNQHWIMESSENNFYIGNQYYFESKLNNKKARYVRLNILSKDLKEFSISELEIFGKRVM